MLDRNIKPYIYSVHGKEMCTSIQPMYCWGSTVNGELGVGAPEVEQLTLPTVMDFAESWNVRQVASGLTHCLILTEEGSVYSCGNNELGQLGHNNITRKPELVDNLENYSIVQVAAGDQHSIALTSWGLIYAWGENGFGQLGLNSTEPHTSVPKLVKSLARKQVIQVACGSSHTLALTSGGELYAWGSNLSGQLGLGHREGPQKDPILIKALLGVPLVHITAGGQHSAALTQAGFLLTWGSNKYGQLGFSSNKDDLYCNVPTPVPNLATYSEPLRYVSVGEGHTAVLDAHGKNIPQGGPLGLRKCGPTLWTTILSPTPAYYTILSDVQFGYSSLADVKCICNFNWFNMGLHLMKTVNAFNST
ncbi:probable E3 ubiquitin-protein ligase HERC4 [Penaeus indicus]|uniref:probable E3 ubiquitin-protein ligase HERC4 n=1 Tax=Penaeus indicus TaxID=29960 RepID=UPI00300D716A